MKTYFSYLHQYLLNLIKIWWFSVVFLLDIIGFFYSINNSILIPPYIFTVILILLFIFANYHLYFINLQHLETLDYSRHQQLLIQSLLIELRKLAPKINYSERTELGQPILNIDHYWTDKQGHLHSDLIGYIDLLFINGNLGLKLRKNERKNIDSDFSILDLKNCLLQNEQLGKLIL